MPESMTTRLARWGFNWFPAYRGTGGRITYISADWGEVHVKLRLNWRTRNYVGTIFGGSMYSAVDPFYMIMLMKRLGSDYVVWDKAAHIRFRRPGRSTLFANFQINHAELEEIKNLLLADERIDRAYTVELRDKHGDVHAVIEKTIHIRRRESS